MRELKFRAWDIKREKMIEVHGLTFPQKPAFKGAIFDGNKEYPWQDEFEVMQSTGLHDKNGDEIYEGDIIQSKKGVNAKVFYPKDNSGFFIRWLNIYNARRKQHWFKPLSWATRRNEFQVIGNIYENPEL